MIHSEAAVVGDEISWRFENFSIFDFSANFQKREINVLTFSLSAWKIQLKVY